MARQSVFESHPKGLETWKKLINKLITQTEAAAILNCSVANISQQLKRYNDSIVLTEKGKKKSKKEKDQEKEIQHNETIEIIKESKELLLKLENEANLDISSSIAWRMIQTALTRLANENMDVKDYITVVRELRHMLQFYFKNSIPDIPKEAIKIDPADEQQILDKMEDICFECPFRQESIKRSNDLQKEARTLFVKS